MKPVLVVAELKGDRACAHTLELVRGAQELMAQAGPAGKETSPVHILVPGRVPETAARYFFETTGYGTTAVTWPVDVTPGSLVRGLLQVVKGLPFSALLMAHTTLGREVIPKLAVAFKGCAVSGVRGICRPQGKEVGFTRSVMDNEKQVTVYPDAGAGLFLTLAPGVFTSKTFPDQDTGNATPSGRLLQMTLPRENLESRVVRKSITLRDQDSSGLADARVIVSAGRGIEEKQNLDRIVAFSKAFSKSSIGASRPLIDQGWLPYRYQVGITGATVAPDLYIACGISGSSQHLAGMAGSRWVVSINKNKDAAMTRHADLTIQADVIEFIDTFLEKISKKER